MDILPMPPDTSETQDGRWTVLPSDHSSLKGGFPIGIMNICRSPTFRQSFHIEETRLLYDVCCVCVDFCKHFLRKPRSSNNLALPRFANIFFIFFIFIRKTDPKLDMIFCDEFLLLATKGPRQHGHCGRPPSVAQDFSCFRFPDLHTHTHIKTCLVQGSALQAVRASATGNKNHEAE